MKRIILVIVLLFIGFSSMVYGQIHKDIYVRTLFIEKIFIHPRGYIIIYDKPSSFGFDTIYIPFGWFTETGGAGEIVWGRHESYPCMSIFWVNGKFSHVKLYVQENLAHPMWENFHGNTENVKEKFNVTRDTFQIEF
ncbi:MAG: hypothetical protein JXB88_19980 [Spirochaetales bacterium]|nr:hypothetical protein [Spirochaetales bacterium]